MPSVVAASRRNAPRFSPRCCSTSARRRSLAAVGLVARSERVVDRRAGSVGELDVDDGPITCRHAEVGVRHVSLIPSSEIESLLPSGSRDATFGSATPTSMISLVIAGLTHLVRCHPGVRSSLDHLARILRRGVHGRHLRSRRARRASDSSSALPDLDLDVPRIQDRREISLAG